LEMRPVRLVEVRLQQETWKSTGREAVGGDVDAERHSDPLCGYVLADMADVTTWCD
jgi:hypothetical protein